MYTKLVIVATFVYLLPYLSPIDAQKCQAEEKTYGDCMKSLSSKVTVSVSKSKVVGSGNRNAFRDQVLQCFKDNKCISDKDKFVPGQNEKLNLCVRKARWYYKQNVISCVQKAPGGDPKYNITDSDTVSDTDNKKKFDAELKFGYDKCREKKINMKPVKACISGKTPKTEASAPAAASVPSLNSLSLTNLNSVTQPFKNLCDSKAKCFTSISPSCNSTLCGCYFSPDVNKNITATLTSCLKDAGVTIQAKQMNGLVEGAKQGFSLEYCGGSRVKNPCDKSLLDQLTGKKGPSTGTATGTGGFNLLGLFGANGKI